MPPPSRPSSDGTRADHPDRNRGRRRAKPDDQRFQHADQASPALIGVTLGPWDYSYHALRNTGECVIAIPSAGLAEAVVDVGNSSGQDMDKWSGFGFTPMQPKEVSAPLVRECFANIECVVADDRLVDEYDLWVLRPVRAWYAPGLRGSGEFHHRGNGTFSTNGSVIDLRDRMTKWPSLSV
ncbi:flavin reductase family protein [Pseudarthrobacter siccitolerans]|uniref:flavin reductase family protein n=1 Tax=Pseudarthrobacter siccitolerans TaxID=861266 RepID=UPI00190FEC27